MGGVKGGGEMRRYEVEIGNFIQRSVKKVKHEITKKDERTEKGTVRFTSRPFFDPYG